MDPLLRTKLRRPFIRANLVSRPRLQARIEEGLQFPLTLVIAPAGSGKTTLVAGSLAGCQPPAAWLSLDREDNQAGRFLTYLVAALQTVDSQVGGEAVELLAGMQPAKAEAVLTSLVNDLEASPGEWVLVLDDYQFINSQAVHDAVAFLLEHSPQSLHLVIATRSDPPLPLARLRARGQMVELRAADLRFTVSEAGEFLNHMMGLDLAPGSVASLEERTEGWVAGLQMAGLSLRDRPDKAGFITGFSGTNRYILDYLIGEILAGQSPETQRFLLDTSILERLSAPLCEAVYDTREVSEGSTDAETQAPLDSQATLDYLDRENVFLVPLDDERTWYRYHHLFADLLKARLNQVYPGRAADLHRRASAWLEANGLISAAIQHLLAAGEPNQAMDLIERYGPAFIGEGDPTVIELAEDLSQEMILGRPRVCLYYTWLLIIHSRIDRALPLLKALAEVMTSTELKTGQAWMLTVARTALAFFRPAARPPGQDLLPAYAFVEEIPTGEVILRNATDLLYGMTLARRGELDRAEAISTICLEREQVASGGSAIPTVASFLTRLHLMQGHLKLAAALCREFLDPIKAKSVRFMYTSGSLKIDLGEVLYEWNHLDEAEQLIREGLRANEGWRNIMTDGFGLVALARVLQAKGDFPGALQAIERLETRMVEHSQPREFDEELRTLRPRLQLASGDLAGASGWADQAQKSEDFRHRPECYRLTLARIFLTQGRFGEVEGLLAGSSPEHTSPSRTARQVETNLILAAALTGLDRWREALSLVEAALTLAEPDGHVRVFYELGEPAEALLKAYLQTGGVTHTGFARGVLAGFPALSRPVPPAPRQAGLPEPLSERELEVLDLLALGRTNLEIANQLVVAPGTVKAHTASIYRKLDVANRTEAVARARQLGILS